MENKLFLFYFVTAIIGSYGYPCSRYDPNLQTCLRGWASDFFSNVSIDPGHLSSYSIPPTGKHICLTGTLTNLNCTGLGSSANDFLFTPSTLTANVRTVASYLHIEAFHNLNARVCTHNYTTVGKLIMNLVNFEADSATVFQLVNNTYYQIQSITITSSSIAGGDLQFISDNSTQPTDDLIAALFNADPTDEYACYKSIVEGAIRNIIMNKCNPALKNYPACVIFTDFDCP